MSRSKQPSYRRQKRSNRPDQAFVVLNGERHYLPGEYDSPESWERYHALLAEWTASGGQAPPLPADELSIAQLMARFLRHAKGYYRNPDGTPTKEPVKFAKALRPLRKLYANTLAA